MFRGVFHILSQFIGRQFWNGIINEQMDLVSVGGICESIKPGRVKEWICDLPINGPTAPRAHEIVHHAPVDELL